MFIFACGQDALPLELTAEVLQALPLIAFEAGSGTRELIDGWFRASGRDISPVMQLGSIEAIKRMVRAGLGYSIVPRMAVAHHDDRQGLRVQSLTPLLHRQLGVVMRQDKILSKGIGEMLRLLRGAVYRLKQCYAVLAGTVMCWLIPAAWYQPGSSIAGTRSCPDDDTGRQ